MYRPTGWKRPEFSSCQAACEWAQSNAAGPFVAFIKGWEDRAMIQLDEFDGRWKWDYRDSL